MKFFISPGSTSTHSVRTARRPQTAWMGYTLHKLRGCCAAKRPLRKIHKTIGKEVMEVFKGGLNTWSICGRERGDGKKQ